METYEEHVKTLFDMDSSSTFSNAQKDHALIIIAEMLDRASNSVIIFCKDLLSEVYSSKRITSSLKESLKRGVNVRVIVQKEPESEEFISASKQANDDLGVRGAIEILQSKSERLSSSSKNFAVMDNKALRYESDHNQQKAMASANQPNMAAVLVASFEQVWQQLKNDQSLAIKIA